MPDFQVREDGEAMSLNSTRRVGFRRQYYTLLMAVDLRSKRLYSSHYQCLKIISSLAHAGSLSDECNVEMELTETGRLTLVEFCDFARSLALENPRWWKRHSEQYEIEAMFEGCTTFQEAINDIGVLDDPKKPKRGTKPTNLIDQR